MLFQNSIMLLYQKNNIKTKNLTKRLVLTGILCKPDQTLFHKTLKIFVLELLTFEWESPFWQVGMSGGGGGNGSDHPASSTSWEGRQV